MQKLLTNIALLFLAFSPAMAQDCGDTQSQIDIFGNALRVRLLNNGSLGWDQVSTLFEPNAGPNPGMVPTTIYTAGLWYGGISVDGNLKLKAHTYSSNGAGLYAGPLTEDGVTSAGDCANWDRHFIVTKAEVEAFLADWADGNLSASHQAIKGWPAKGNPYFDDVWGFTLPFTSTSLAPFFDQNGDGQYNYLNGDYPVVALRNTPLFVPDVEVWSVFNDVGGPDGPVSPQGMGMEIQMTSFAFNCSESPVLNNTLFTSHKMIYRGTEPVDSFSIGMFVDFDLGCFDNDHIGSNPATGTFYGFNATNNDMTNGNCSGVKVFGANPPVQAVTFLNKSLDHFMPLYSSNFGNFPQATLDPSLTFQYFNLLNGHWKDNTPLTTGGNGYNPGSTNVASHAYPDNPNLVNGWSMATANIPGTDVRGLGSTYIGELLPGAVDEFVLAWSYHRKDGLSNLENINPMESEVAQLRNLYLNQFESPCNAIVDAKDLPQYGGALAVAPNPAAAVLRLDFSTLPEGVLLVTNVAGQQVFNGRVRSAQPLEINVANWPNGIYVARYQTAQGVWSQKIVIEK
jgi:hypothetical protein